MSVFKSASGTKSEVHSLEAKCTKLNNMNVIAELPEDGDKQENLQALKKFFPALLPDVNVFPNCMKLRIQIAHVNGIVLVQSDECTTSKCVENAINKATKDIVTRATSGRFNKQ